jgi:hypothetical protein
MSKNYIVFLSLLFLSGCASTSTFNAYTSQVSPVIQDIRNNRLIDLTKQFAEQTRSADKILYLMERGRIAQIQGDVDLSQASFKDAIDAIQQNDQKAVISASGAGAQASAMLVNDNAIPYQGDGYERVMLYHYQAMNYLARNDVEGAGVEFRRANAEQEDALKRHEKEIDAAQKSAKDHNVASTMPDAVVKAYAGLDQVAGTVKDSFQNAYTFYLSGIIYEIQGQPNDAYIDYKKALEIFPGNSYLQKNVIRLARQLRMNDDLGELKKKFPGVLESLSNDRPGGDLIVLLEDEFVLQKEEIKVPIPIALQTVVLTAAAFPIYNPVNVPVFPLTITEGGNVLASSEPVCFTSALAIKALKEKVPGMVIRQIIRSTAKGVAANEAKKQFGALGSLAMSAFNLISENADVRSWTTLPYDVQIMQVRLAPGEHELVLNQAGSGIGRTIKVNIKEKGKVILRAIRAGNNFNDVILYPAEIKAADPVQAVASVNVPK